MKTLVIYGLKSPVIYTLKTLLTEERADDTITL